jgi:capsule polysaccharide export protein KpsE/RkpR
MSPRLRRIEKILSHRQKELDDRVTLLAVARAREATGVATAEAMDAQAKEAADGRRRLTETGADVTAFQEAGEWLVATSRRAERAWAIVTTLRAEVAKVQVVVVQARTKMKQAEQLKARVELVERRIDDRKERRRDDEAAQRVTQRRAAVGGSR